MNDEPYRSPQAEPGPVVPINRKRWRAFAAAGVVLSSLHLGSFGATSSVLKAPLGKPGELIDTRKLKAEITSRVERMNKIVAVLRGLSTLGLAFCSISLFGPGNRERWFYWSVIAVGSISLLIFPFGTLVAVVLLAGLHVRREEFKPLIADP